MACSPSPYKIVPIIQAIELFIGDTFPFRGWIKDKENTPDFYYDLSGATGVFTIFNEDGTTFYTTSSITFTVEGYVNFDISNTITELWEERVLTYKLTVVFPGLITRTVWAGAFKILSI